MKKIWFFLVCVGHGLWAVVSPEKYGFYLKEESEKVDIFHDPFSP